MTEPTDQPESALHRFPLSGTQEWLCGADMGDEAGTFGRLFTSEMAVRIPGQVDVEALRCALDDVVRRHEMLRTIVARDARPRYQQVYPPAPATLEVRDLPPVSEKSRDVRVQEIITSTGRRGMSVRKLPLLWAQLNRFDDQDSLLVVTTHHTAADGWAINVVFHDLAAFYRARVTASPPDLPDAAQYRDFVAWEQARLAGPDAEVALEYWRVKLSGAQIFALPSDHSFSGVHTRPYSAYYFSVDAGVTAELARLSTAMRSSVFIVLLAAFNVLTHEITGKADPVIHTFSSGRDDLRTHNIVGPIANPLPLRTNFDGCVTFRDVVKSTRRTCLEAYSHLIPSERIEREVPDLRAPLGDPMLCKVVFSMPQSQIKDADLEFVDGSYEVRKEVVQHEAEGVDLARGSTWDMDLLKSGELTGTIRFNLDNFNLDTVIGWASAYCRILSGGVLDPDGEWKKLSARI
jgi:condensation enzyme